MMGLGSTEGGEGVNYIIYSNNVSIHSLYLGTASIEGKIINQIT